MFNVENLKAQLLSLQTDLATIQSEGDILTDCWIAQAKPGSKKNKYPRLKSRKPIFNGKKTQYLSIHGSALADAKAAICRGKVVKQLNKRIQAISDEIAQFQRKSSPSLKTSIPKQSRNWYTPPELIALVCQVTGGIDLDPASDDIAQQWVQASNYYTPALDGLSQPWFGRVWLHPPTGAKTAKWVNKLLAEYESQRVSEAVLLVQSSIGRKWFQKLTKLFPICFPNEPLKFLNSKGIPQIKPEYGSVIFYLGQNSKQFDQVFGAIGSVSIPTAIVN